MKRRIITTVTVCVFLALVLAVRLSDREKNDNSIPSKETVAAYILEKGEQYAAEQLRGQDRNSVRRSWGDPDAMPSGIWADVWDLDADTTLPVLGVIRNLIAVFVNVGILSAENTGSKIKCTARNAAPADPLDRFRQIKILRLIGVLRR